MKLQAFEKLVSYLNKNAVRCKVIWGRGWAEKGDLHFRLIDDNPLKLCAERWQAFLKSVYLFVTITENIPNMNPRINCGFSSTNNNVLDMIQLIFIQPTFIYNLLQPRD